jgi:hypothetical protein
MTDDKKKPDLEFTRQHGRAAEGIEFYKDSDQLEIQTWNLDGDTFLIILEPKEVKKLRDFLQRIE